MTTVVPIFLAAVVGLATFMTVAAARYVSRKLDRKLAVTTATATAAGLACFAYFKYGLAVLVVASTLVAASLVRFWLWRRSSNAKTVNRKGDRVRRRSGVATWWQIAFRCSWWAMHRQARAIRPHLRGGGFWDRWRIATTELATRLCKSNGMWVWSSLEDVLLVIGGPRKGKTVWLAGAICDAPGAVLATSTRLEIVRNTMKLRERPVTVKGWLRRLVFGEPRKVWIYNPGGLGDLESTVKFNPLAGCEDPVEATLRAEDMIPQTDDGGGDSDREWWDAAGRRILAVFLHAAALDPQKRRTMHDVHRWVSNPESSLTELNALLSNSPMREPYMKAIHQFIKLADRTRSGVLSAVDPALAWLMSPTAVATIEGDIAQFDVKRFIENRETLYLLGRHETHNAPLVAALTGYIARAVRSMAAKQEHDRIDPPLTMALDEAVRICHVPLDNWSGDAGGSGIRLIIVCQSRADLVKRWGKNGAATIMNNAGTVMLYGGTKDAEDLAAWVQLIGDRDEVVKTVDGNGKVLSKSPRKTPVVTAAQLREMEKFHVVVIGETPVIFGKVDPMWSRRGWEPVAIGGYDPADDLGLELEPLEGASLELEGATPERELVDA